MPPPVFVISEIQSFKEQETYYEAASITAGSTASHPPIEGQLWPRGNPFLEVK